MEIRVKCGCGVEECPEWAIVELQGVVEPQSSSIAGDLPNLQIGRLCCCSEQGGYTFTVGYHELSGTKLPLKKPLLVLRKSKGSSEGRTGDSEDPSRAEVEVIGIARYRILFKTRPKALISSGLKSKSKRTEALN